MSKTPELSHLDYLVRNNRPVRVLAYEHPEQIGTTEAVLALDLLRETYADTFRYEIPPAAFDERFNTRSDSAIKEQREHMQRAVDRGSRYHVITSGFYEFNGWEALAKTTPSRASRLQKLHLSAPNCFLNDLVVRPDQQGKYLGHAALDAALSHFEDRRWAALHGFTGNSKANNWFGYFGFARVQGEIPALEIGRGFYLRQDLYSTEGRAAIGGIRQQLQAKARPLVSSNA